MRLLDRALKLTWRLLLLIWSAVGHLAAYGSFAVSLLRRQPHYIVERWSGARSLDGARRVAVFVHYDRGGVVHDYVLYYVRQLRAAGFEVVFVSNAPLLVPADREKVRALCAVVVRRHNVGYDFGAFKDGVGLLNGLDGIDELVLANDSVYGPFHDLSEVLSKTNGERAAVWGITDSWQHGYHLQTYFVLFKTEALRHPAFARFWQQVRYVQSKAWVIRQYEVGLSRWLIRAGLRCAALYPYRRAAADVSDAVRTGGLLDSTALSSQHKKYLAMLSDTVDRGIPLNGSHFFWDYLVGEMGCPFLKRELLQKNPARVPYVHCWDEIIQRSSSYNPDLILRHLEASLKDHWV